MVLHRNNSSDSIACTSLIICIFHLLESLIFLLTIAVWLELSLKQFLINKIALNVCCFTYYLTSARIHSSQTVGDLVFQTTNHPSCASTTEHKMGSNFADECTELYTKNIWNTAKHCTIIPSGGKLMCDFLTEERPAYVLELKCLQVEGPP